jgi:hypothetical protein
MTAVNETYTGKVAASGLIPSPSNKYILGGFFCTTSGTLEIREQTVGGTVVVPSFAVTAGVFYPLPFCNGVQLYAILTASAGTFGVK